MWIKYKKSKKIINLNQVSCITVIDYDKTLAENDTYMIRFGGVGATTWGFNTGKERSECLDEIMKLITPKMVGEE